MTIWDHQLASYSPIRLRDVWSAARGLLTASPEPLSQLTAILARDYSATQIVLTDSGTHALQLAMAAEMSRMSALDDSRHGRVALPAFQCFDLATAAVGSRVPVSFYDIDPDTLTPELDSLERSFRNGARVAVIAPLYGIPVDWEALSAVAARHGASLIEDAAQGHGAVWKGRRLGSLGDVSILSFGRGKGWTGGGGGALLLRGDAGRDVIYGALLRTLRPGAVAELKNSVAMAAQWTLGRPSVYGLPRKLPWLHLGETVYHAPTPVDAMRRSSARAILSSREPAGAEARTRRDNAARMAAASRPARAIPVATGATAGYIRYPVRVPGGMAYFVSPDDAARLGIAPSYPTALSDLAQLRASSSAAQEDFRGARTLVGELITLPTHSRVRARDVETIAQLFDSQ